jgi:PAS domain S-box-containing protein
LSIQRIKKTGVIIYLPLRGISPRESMNKENSNSPEALRRTKTLFDAIWDNSAIAIYETDAEGQCLSVNKEWCKFAGISKEDALGDGWQQGLHPDDKERIFALWNKHAKTKKPWNFEYRFRTSENVITWVMGTSNPIINKQGEITGYIGVNTDITERKMSEDALYNSRLLLLSSLESQIDTIHFSIDKNYRYLYFNGAHCESMKKSYNTDIAEGMNILDCITVDDDRKVAKNNYDRALRGESHTNVRMYGEGNPAYYESFFNPIINNNNKIIGTTALARDITDRVQKEAEILTITDQWQSTFDSVNDAIWLMDKEHNILRSNKKAELLFGKENIGKKCYNIVHGTDCPIEGCPVQLAFIEKSRKSMEFQIGNNWYDISADPILDINGMVTSAVHIVRDITGQRKVEDDLRLKEKELLASLRKTEESEKSLNTIIENIPFAVFAHNLDGEFIKVNNFSTKYTGYSKQELEKMTVADIDKDSLSRNDRENIWLQLNQFGEKQIISNHYKKDGSTYPVEITLASITLKNKPILLAIVQNISERQKVEQALKESELLLKQTQKISKVGGWSYDVRSKQIKYTDVIHEIHAKTIKTPEEGIQFYHPEDKKLVWNSFSDSISKHKSYDLEVRFINAKGENLFVRTIGQPIIKNGKVVKIHGNLVNITERKKAELALKESEQMLKIANATKDKFFSIIAHDLRSPFNNMLGFSELLIENIRTYPVEKSEEFIHNIYSTTKHTLSLLDNLLTWAKTQTGKIDFKPENLKLKSIIQEIIDTLNSSAIIKNIALNSQVDDIIVYADQNMLQTILRNLVSNALKFINSGGRVDINAVSQQNQIEITVSDNGVGIPEETLNKLFKIDSNITTKGTANEKGSGLGLIICKEFAEKHGGKIWVESELGKGSSFHFTVPTSTEPKGMPFLT